MQVKVWVGNKIEEIEVNRKDVKRIAENVLFMKNGEKRVLAENPKGVETKLHLNEKRILLG